MAATLTAQQVPVTGIKPTFVAATGANDTVSPDDNLVLVVANGDAASKTVTLLHPGSQYGQANPSVPRVIPAGETHYIRIPREFADPATGLISITYSAVTSVTVALVRF